MAGTNIGGLAANVSADVAPFTDALARASRSAQSFGGRLDSTSSQIASFARSAAAAGAAYLGVSELISRSDEWTQFSNKIRVVTQEFGTFQVTQKAVFDLAQEVRAPIDDVAGAYSRLQGSVKSLGVSQADTLKVTEGLLKSFAAYGASGQEAASTIQQLGQALGSGRLQGQELNAIMESSLPVTEALAKHFGVTTGELKKMGEQGKLTSKEVFTALKDGSDSFIKSYENVAPTFKQGFDVLSNSATRAIGEFTKFTGISEDVGKSLATFGGYLDRFSLSVESGEFGMITRVIGSQWDDLLGKEIPLYLRAFEITVAQTGKKVGDSLTNNFYKVLPSVSAELKSIGATMSHIFSKDLFDKDGKQILEKKLQGIWAERDASVKSAEDQIKAAHAKIAAYQEELKVKGAALNIKREEAKVAPQVNEEAQKQKDRAKVKSDKKQQRDDTLVNSLSAETKAMVRELGLRQQISDTYRAADLGANASYHDQQLADIRAAEQVKSMEAEARYQEDMARLQERRAQDLLRVQGDRLAIEAVNAQYDQQEILAEEMKQQSITDAQRSGQDARKRLRDLERQEAIDTALGLGAQLMQVTQGHSKRAFEFSKKMALASATIDGYQSAGLAWKKGMDIGGPWVAAAFAASSLLKTASYIQGIRGTNFSGGGGGGASAGGGGVPSVAASAPAGGGGAAPGPAAGQTQMVSFVGDFFNGSAVEKIAKGLVQFQKDGGTVVWSQ